MNNKTIQIRVDSKTKKEVNEIFRSLGLDLSTGIKIFFHQVVRSKSIPFPLITENGFTPEQEKTILAESEATRKAYLTGKIKGYTSSKKLFKDLAK